MNTTLGAAQGYVETVAGVPVAVFRGLPYAAPPVGRSGRWKPPRKPAPWSGVRNATQDAAFCYEYGNTASPLESEDCLYLNVFTAASSVLTPGSLPASLPVFVWVHGGGLMSDTVESYNQVESLVGLSGGDVIVVAVSYRLNAWGFLATPQLAAEDPRGVSGNLGLLDVQQALSWVQANAAAFGGDPSRVTIYGQSSGGTAILALLASPGSKGLFHAAISLSGSPNITMDIESVYSQNQAGWLVNSGCANASDVLGCMYALSPSAVDAAIPSNWSPPTYFPASPAGNNLPGLAVVDGVTVAMPLIQALSQGLIDVPIILATMRDEDDVSPDPTVMSWTTPSDFQSFLNTQFAGWAPQVAPTLFTLYQNIADASPPQGFYDLDADTGVGCGHLVLGAAAAAGFKSPVYVGVTVHQPGSPTPGFPQYPFHMWDYMCSTRTWDLDGAYVPTTRDAQFGDVVRRNWLSLAANGTTLPEWEPFLSGGRADNLALLGGAPDGGIAMSPGYKQDVCQTLATLGIDQKYWWIN